MCLKFDIQDKCGFRGGDTNLRRYVGNNPTNVVDPSGLEGEKPVTSDPATGTLYALTNTLQL